MAYILRPLLGSPEIRSFDSYSHLDYVPSIVETSARFYIAWFNTLNSYKCIQMFGVISTTHNKSMMYVEWLCNAMYIMGGSYQD